jgi:outer membrane lipoprotein-sorting protein
MKTRNHLLFVVCAAVICSNVAHGDDQVAVKELLDKVTNAYGGPDQTAKLKAIAIKGKVTASEGGMDITFAFDASIQGLDTFKMDAEVTAGGQTQRIVMVINGNKGWAYNAAQNKTEEAPKEAVPMVRQFLSALRGPGNPQDLLDKDISLSHGGENKVNDTETAILRVQRKDFSEITMYFDKKTGLPLKSETKVKQPTGNEERTYEFHYSEFKNVGGVQHPHRVKIVQEGKDRSPK